MKRYCTYVSTPEAVWYKEIPGSWRSTKMREIFSERNEKVSDKDFAALSVGKMGVVPQLETAVKTDNGDNRKLVREGDFAINSRSDRKGAGGISDYDGSVSLIITVLKPHNEINRRFYHYLLRSYYFSEEFYRNGQGLVSDLWSTKWDKMRNIYLPVPPRAEQDQIVRFLDWKVSQIDRLIAGYQKEIELLKERRVTIIDRAVTKGIDPEVDCMTPKAEWMGAVPAQWKSCRMKNIFTEINIRSIDGSEPHLSMSQKKGLITDEEMKERRLLSENYIGGKVCEKDDLVLNRLKAHLGVFALAPQKGVVSPDYTVLRLKQNMVIPKYAEYLLKSNACRKELRIRVRGIVEGFWRLYTEDLGAIPVCLPDLPEQAEILNYISFHEKRIDAAIEGIDHQISLLREYRTRLICDAVTGQIDVRDVVIPKDAAAGDAPVFCNDTDEGEVGMDADEY